MATDKVTELLSIFCPACGHGFTHERQVKGKAIGGVGGAIAGAKVGAGIGLAGGPIGAMAGTIPGAILGAIFGSKAGRSLADDPKCPKCSQKFVMPG